MDKSTGFKTGLRTRQLRAQRSGFATPWSWTGFQEFRRCKTVLQERFDLRYLCEMGVSKDLVQPNRPMRLTDVSQLPPPSDHTMFSFSTSEEAQVPTKKNPIRFAVQYRNGRTSNAWGVQARDTGDAYIYCRDNMKGQKISLHASGKQHISIDPRLPRAANLTEKQFMNQWYEPDEGIATFRLIFPSWGIQLDEEQREKFKSTWMKTDIFIEGHHEFLTVVSFHVIGDKVRVRKRSEFPGFQLGELSLRVGKKLAITADWELERGLKTWMESTLKRLPPNFMDIIKDYPGKTLAVCVTGNCAAPNSVYMVSFPVIYSIPNP